MKKSILLIVGIIVPLIFAVNILRSFYLEDGDFVGLTYMLRKFEGFDNNTSDYIYEIAQVGASWRAITLPDLTIGQWLENFFVALWDSICLPFQIIFLLCQDMLNVIDFIIDILGFYPGAPEGAVGG